MIEWAYRPLRFMDDCRRRFGDIYTMRLPQQAPFVFLAAPEAIKKVFTGDAEVLHAGKGNRIIEPLVGHHSVLILDGTEHMRQRRLLLPPLHGERMHAYAELMRSITEESLARWPKGRPFALHERMQAITLDVILRAVFGLDEGAEMRSLAALLVELMQPPPMLLAFLPLVRRDIPGSPYAKFLRRRDRVRGELIAIIRRRRGEGEAAAARRTDVLSLLLAARDEAGLPMTDEELRDELMTMIVAGHETTATALSWAFERLLAAPEAMAPLAEEIGRFGGRELDLARVREMEYLDATIKETLRLRPIIPIVVRELQAEWEVEGYQLPKGTRVAPCVYLAQRRAELFPEPERFRPARWLGAKVDPYAWLPFGGGIRRCVGMAFAQYEMTIVLATVLAGARLRRARGEAGVTRRSVTLAPKGGTEVILEARN
jgi:cytochrome P450